jgi:hypothetical protein
MVDRKTTSIDRLYSEGRHYPGAAQARDPGARQCIEHSPSMKSKGPSLRNNRPQDPEDRHGPGYDGDAKGWLRGARGGEPTGHKESAEGKPNFDKQNPWRKGK